MQIVSSSGTDVGKKRKVNEDSIFSSSEVGLFVVCDGMGGHNAGDLASQTAAEVIEACVTARHAKNGKKGKFQGSPESILKESVELANQAIWEISNGRAEYKGMGTTVAAAIIDSENKKLITAHAGDSRVYRLRGSELEQLTTDHSLVEEQLAMGLISKAEAEISGQKNIITRALGQKAEVEVAVSVFDIEEGDLVLVCSDGLTNMLSHSDIKSIIRGSDPGNLDEIVINLIEMANAAGGADNISVVLASI